jgi:1,2-diacylglycerol 3-beta-glucosyltransferase
MPPKMIRRSLEVVQLGLTVVDLYLVSLLAAAVRRTGTATEIEGEQLRFAVLVPAHDEEAVIETTLASLGRMSYPPERWIAFVVADNCSDATAQIAGRAGARVLERHEPHQRGKGRALNWALDRVLASPDAPEAIAIVDADCEVSSNLLERLDRRLRSGAVAVQASYTVANPGASTSSALRFAAFALMNTVRPLGKAHLRLSAGLLGTGMAFRRAVLDRHRFAPSSLVEDTDLHLRLVTEGERVEFEPDARVMSDMPTSLGPSRAQQTRWEGGRIELLRTWTRPLLATAIRRRDPVCLHAWLELLVPPQSLLAFAHVVATATALATGSRSHRRVAVLDAALQGAFVIGGLRLASAPASVYRALVAAPILVAQKLGILGRLAASGRPRTWERTERRARTL